MWRACVDDLPMLGVDIAIGNQLTRANGRLIPIVPSPLIRSALTLFDWAIAEKAEDAQRRELRRPTATVPAARGWPVKDPPALVR